MKIALSYLVGMLFSQAVWSSGLEETHEAQSSAPLQELALKLRSYEFLKISDAAEKELAVKRCEITTLMRKNRALIDLHGQEVFVNEIKHVQHLMFNNLDQVVPETMNQQIRNFKMSASAAQISGALRFAHSREIKGETAEAHVLEIFGVDHGLHVSSTAHQVAPLIAISMHISEQIGKWLQKKLLSAQGSTALRRKPFKVINASIGALVTNVSILDYASREYFFTHLIKVCLRGDALLIKSAGNENLSLDDPKHGDHYVYQVILEDSPGLLDKGIIIVGNLQYGFKPACNSTYPGQKEFFQNNFIWALGSDVLGIVAGKYMRFSGTSMAAPSVTGACCLIAQKHPTFSKIDIKECILESARRDFFVDHEHGGFIHVSPNNTSYSIDTRHPHYLVAKAIYNPAIWGKGILDIRRALMWAEMKAQGHSLKQMKEELEKQDSDMERKSAVKLQRTFRRYLQKHSITPASQPAPLFGRGLSSFAAKPYKLTDDETPGHFLTHIANTYAEREKIKESKVSRPLLAKKTLGQSHFHRTKQPLEGLISSLNVKCCTERAKDFTQTPETSILGGLRSFLVNVCRCLSYTIDGHLLR